MRGELQHLSAQGGGEPDRAGGAVHDLEAIDAGGHEVGEIAPVVLPIFGERGEPERALAVQLGEQPQHRARVAVIDAAIDRGDGPQRHDVLRVHAPFDPREQADRFVHGLVEDDVVVRDVGRLEALRGVPGREVLGPPAGAAVV